jgi:hypothetical protein
MNSSLFTPARASESDAPENTDRPAGQPEIMWQLMPILAGLLKSRL